MCLPIQFPHYDQIALAGKSECTVLIDRQHASGNGPLCPAPRCGVKGLKDMILQALDDAGGQQYLVEQAHKNPAAS